MKLLIILLPFLVLPVAGQSQTVIRYTENPWKITQACIDCGVCGNGQKSEQVAEKKTIDFFCGDKLIGFWTIEKQSLTACKSVTYRLTNSRDDRQHENLGTLNDIVDLIAVEVRSACREATEIADRDSQEREIAEYFASRFFIKTIAPEIQGEVFKAVAEMPHIDAPVCDQNFTDPVEVRKCYTRAMLEYIQSNLKYPKGALTHNIEGTVLMTYIVEPDGSFSNIEIKKDIGAGCGEEALRLVELMQATKRWIPGMQNGKPVRVEMNLPVRFKLK